jgi:hypothetical protein
MKPNNHRRPELHHCSKSIFFHHDCTAVYHDDCAGLSGAKIAASENSVQAGPEVRLYSHLVAHGHKLSGHQVQERETNSLEPLPF